MGRYEGRASAVDRSMPACKYSAKFIPSINVMWRTAGRAIWTARAHTMAPNEV